MSVWDIGHIGMRARERHERPRAVPALVRLEPRTLLASVGMVSASAAKNPGLPRGAFINFSLAQLQLLQEVRQDFQLYKQGSSEDHRGDPLSKSELNRDLALLLRVQNSLRREFRSLSAKNRLSGAEELAFGFLDKQVIKSAQSISKYLKKHPQAGHSGH